MEICTCYFAHYKLLKSAGYRIVSIARVSPDYLPNMFQYEPLKPSLHTRNLLKVNNDKEGYIESYKKQLREYYKSVKDKDHRSIQKELLQLVTGNQNNRDFDICKVRDIEKIRIVLLCYEAPPKFCHREIVREYFEKVVGYKVKELAKNDIRY